MAKFKVRYRRTTHSYKIVNAFTRAGAINAADTGEGEEVFDYEDDASEVVDVVELLPEDLHTV